MEFSKKVNSACPLAVSHLTVEYDKKLVLWDILWEVSQGMITAVVGPNGAGKSSLIKAILGLVPRLGGSVLFWGQPFKEVKERIAYIPQKENLVWDFPINVRELVSQGAYARLSWYQSVRGREKERVNAALERLSLTSLEKRGIGELSGGQQRKCLLARALVQEADLYILDEPFTGLDHHAEKQIMEHLKSLAQEGKTVIIVHHDLNDVPRLFDNVLLLNVTVVAAGAVEEVFVPDLIEKTYGQSFSLLEKAVWIKGAKSRGEL